MAARDVPPAITYIHTQPLDIIWFRFRKSSSQPTFFRLVAHALLGVVFIDFLLAHICRAR
jgi:hypothetical protein